MSTGTGLGFVDVFDTSGQPNVGSSQTETSNAPWGLALVSKQRATSWSVISVTGSSTITIQ